MNLLGKPLYRGDITTLYGRFGGFGRRSGAVMRGNVIEDMYDYHVYNTIYISDLNMFTSITDIIEQELKEKR